MIKVSFIIPTKNRKGLLNKCLKSLIDNCKGLTYEIIVIDDGSKDGIDNIIKNLKNISLIKNQKSLGPVKSRNIGLSKSKGKFIVFLDDDVEITKNIFSDIFKMMEKDKIIGIVGPQLLYSNNKIQESARSFPTPLSVLWRGTILHKFLPTINFYKKYVMLNNTKVQEVDWVLGACQIVRREMFNTLGFFDEKYFMYYGEDIDLCFRAKKAGWKVIYYPYSIVYHHYARVSAKSIINKAKVEHIKSIIYYFYKMYFHKM